MNTEDKIWKTFEPLIDMISSKQICSWEHLLMMYNILGVDECITEEIMFKFFLHNYNTERFYDFFRSLFDKTSSGICDKFITREMINKLLREHKSFISGGNPFSDMRTNSIEILKNIDTRNPKILLNYFLKDSDKLPFRADWFENYSKMLDIIISRTELRATKFKSYNIILERLKNKKSDILELNRFTQ